MDPFRKKMPLQQHQLPVNLDALQDKSQALTVSWSNAEMRIILATNQYTVFFLPCFLLKSSC